MIELYGRVEPEDAKLDAYVSVEWADCSGEWRRWW